MDLKKAYGVSVLIMQNNKVLSVARRDDPTMFGLPGGKVEPNETEAESAIRECLEETGLKIWNLKEVFRFALNDKEGVTFTCNFEGIPSTQPNEPECSWQDPKVLTTGIFGEYNQKLFDLLKII